MGRKYWEMFLLVLVFSSQCFVILQRFTLVPVLNPVLFYVTPWAAFLVGLVSSDTPALCRGSGDSWVLHKQDSCVPCSFLLAPFGLKALCVSQSQTSGSSIPMTVAGVVDVDFKRKCVKITLDKESYLLPLFHSISGLKRTAGLKTWFPALLCHYVTQHIFQNCCWKAISLSPD